ncbi:MAG TPA: hypothetical protein VKU40_12820 [Thermoanaerobaculia bacterium]|nr:hypothetical protein [Thermoanaerobaculia bacterium]
MFERKESDEHTDPEVVFEHGSVPRRRRAAVERYRARTADSPEEMGCMVKLGGAPAAPWLPQELHGAPVVATLACHSAGTGEAVDADLAAVRRRYDPDGLFAANLPG